MTSSQIFRQTICWKRFYTEITSTRLIKKVKSNKGAGGVEGMSVDELLAFLKDNGRQLIQQIREGKYKPNPV
ncbi:hypothetical protein CLORY_30630 [Clostridium oryzae]|uniref:Group II intron-encoded protein LtrA n=2 Tax=Clostridium oryzae TaxID=1450648 RepID=A0A1V4IIZ6_9CLOT|nr:hypothetical protein CLORY_30630 [Clostridium oryzae]